MTVYIDEQRVELAGDRLAEVLAAASERLEPRGRLIVEVAIDGQALVGEQLDEHGQMAVDGREIRLRSVEPVELVVAALTDSRAGLGEARELQMQAAELLQQDEAESAMRKVAGVVGLWQQVQAAVIQSLRLTSVRLEDLDVDGQSSQQLIEQLLEQLKQVRQLLQDSDTIGLADTLAYEWPTTLERWDRMIELLIDRVREADGQPT